MWLCFVIYYYSVTLFVSKNSYILLNFRIIRSYIRRKKKERTLFARTEFKYSRQEFNRDHQKEKRKGISLSLSLSPTTANDDDDDDDDDGGGGGGGGSDVARARAVW